MTEGKVTVRDRESDSVKLRQVTIRVRDSVTFAK